MEDLPGLPALPRAHHSGPLGAVGWQARHVKGIKRPLPTHSSRVGHGQPSTVNRFLASYLTPLNPCPFI